MGDKEIVEMLLDRSADVAARNGNGKPPIFSAVENGNVEVVELLLSYSEDVNAQDNCGRRLLHIAAEKGYVRIAELLLKRGADVNSVCSSPGCEGYTPLHFAAGRCCEAIVGLLLKKGAFVDAVAKHGFTSLHIAAKRGHLKIVENLLKYGANIDALSGKDITPLWLAIENRHEEIVKLLLDYGANVNFQWEGMSVLLFAVERCQPRIIDHILKHSPDLDNESNKCALYIAICGCDEECNRIVDSLIQYGFTFEPEDIKNSQLFLAAVEKGFEEVVDHFLKNGANVNQLPSCSIGNRNMPLHIAVKNKKDAMVKLLIANGADVNAYDYIGRVPLVYAILNTDINIVELLLANGATVEHNPDILRFAIQRECREVIEILLRNGADVNLRDKNGRTALHFVPEDRDTKYFRLHYDDNVKAEIAHLILSWGACANAKSKDGVTPLHTSVEKGYVKVIEALLQFNADINCKNEEGMTPLHIAVQKGNLGVIELLLKCNADINIMNRDCVSPLHIAAHKGSVDIVETLLKNNADVNCINKHKLTSLHIAVENDCTEVVKVLLKYNVDIDAQEINGRTALHIACLKQNEQIVISLIKHGCDINIFDGNNDTAPYIVSSTLGLNRAKSERNDFWDFLLLPYSLNYIDTILKQHITKMITADLYVNKQNLLFLDEDSKTFENQCKEEVARMKKERIGNSKITFHDVLIKSVDQLSFLLRNETVANILRSEKFKTNFPKYADMIKSHFRKGELRKNLLDQANQYCYSIFHRIPFDCTVNILAYLSNEDLRQVIAACWESNISILTIS